MQDNEKLVERLRDLGIHSADIAATTIEAQAREIAELRAEVERRKYDGIHTCHERCERPACVARRERDQARAEVEECHKNISMKAEFIDATLNDCAAKDQTIDELRTQLTETQARLAEAVGLLQKWRKVAPAYKAEGFVFDKTRVFLSKQEPKP